MAWDSSDAVLTPSKVPGSLRADAGGFLTPAIASAPVTSDVLDDPELSGCLDQLASVPNLLVACDYDGTIAPIVEDPMKALPLRETSVALRNLAGLPQTDVAVISGRALRDLAALQAEVQPLQHRHPAARHRQIGNQQLHRHTGSAASATRRPSARSML